MLKSISEEVISIMITCGISADDILVFDNQIGNQRVPSRLIHEKLKQRPKANKIGLKSEPLNGIINMLLQTMGSFSVRLYERRFFQSDTLLIKANQP